jgi:hypothetical protein
MKLYATVATPVGRAEIQDNEDGTWTVKVIVDGLENTQTFNTIHEANAHANLSLQQ